MIPEGKYRARAVDGEYGRTSKGGEMVAVRFEVTQGPAEGQHLTWYGYFTEKTGARTIESLRYCGCTFPGDDVTNLEGLGDAEVELDVQVEHDDRGPRSRVRWVNSLGRKGALKEEARMDAGEKRAFAAQMRGLVRAAPKPAAPPAPRRRPEDDVPF